MARCSSRDNFNGNVALFNVYKWIHSDFIVIKLTANTYNENSHKTYILDFSTLIINGMAPFCKLMYRTTPVYNSLPKTNIKLLISNVLAKHYNKSLAEKMMIMMMIDDI